MAAFPFQSSSPHSDTSNKEEVTKLKEIDANPHRHRETSSAVEEEKGTPVKYMSLCHVYSATSPCVTATGSSNVMSKKVKARKLTLVLDHAAAVDDDDRPNPTKPSSAITISKPAIVNLYSRNRKRGRLSSFPNPPVYDTLLSKFSNVPPLPHSIVDKTENLDEDTNQKKKRRKTGCSELINLGLDSTVLVTLDGPRLRESRNRTKIDNITNNNSSRTRQQRNKLDNAAAAALETGIQNHNVNSNSSTRTKRWVRLSYEGVDPKKFIGLQCKVYWPLDADWYSGRVVGYDLESDRHQVEYEDGDEESVILSNERIKFYVSPEEMDRLRLSCNLHCSDTDDLDVDEMVVLAASLDDCHEVEPGDIIWAKLTGHAVWPAIVLDESLVSDHKGLSKFSGEKSVVVQFFGTHDFARVRTKQVISFLKGLLSSYHLKCKKPDFIRSLEEAKVYLSKQKLPTRMLQLRNSVEADCGSARGEDEGHTHSGDDECFVDEGIQRKLDGLKSCPFEIGDLQVQSLGEIVKDSKCFQDKRCIWPVGYKAVRKFLSITDPSLCTLYTMEVLRDAASKNQPLFRVTSDDGEQFDGSTPSASWNKVYRRIRNLPFVSSDYSKTEGVPVKGFESGSDMFGLSHPEVLKLLRETSNLNLPSKLSKLKPGRYQDMPVGYRPVHVQWKDLDKCNVCHMDEYYFLISTSVARTLHFSGHTHVQHDPRGHGCGICVRFFKEYVNNLFLQCDKCRMMVHARCYGELEPVDGVLWLCNLCRPGASDVSPPCCLCPVTGGAMKPTTDGRWAHLACAMWIPETCLSDIKKMEPIDGLSRINKDRWKLLCSICGVSYGACIQCSNSNCYVAYHPLCARAAGFCAELADEDRLHMIPVEEDEDNQCIRLVSFCKKHSPIPLNERPVSAERIRQAPCEYSDFTPPVNPSGCARSEPYNYFGRRGRKEPEALAAASLKRSFVENRPYLVGGYCQHDSMGPSSSSLVSSKLIGVESLKTLQLDASRNIFSMAEKYIYMRKTFRKRLAFGKSGIHGFGIFTKQPHRAGDMVIEYTGELVRPPIADRREHLIYNSLVGAGTYMFRIDDERVIDATRAGSIAHLINHSCEPNCYSRVISVNGDEHIIIFAKRDIKQWEELTYDYRFFSIDEQLACYCGFPRCRGVVNDIEAEERVAKVYAPRSELIDWRGE